MKEIILFFRLICKALKGKYVQKKKEGGAKAPNKVPILNATTKKRTRKSRKNNRWSKLPKSANADKKLLKQMSPKNVENLLNQTDIKGNEYSTSSLSNIFVCLQPNYKS